MNRNDPTTIENDMADRVDAAFSELSRAIGPMFLVFGVTIVGWLALRFF